MLEGFSLAWGISVGQGTFAKLYTITSMDVAADFVMDIWVTVVATMGIGIVGVKFTCVAGIGVVGMGWAITPTLYLLLAGTLVLFFLSVTLVPGAFLVKGLYGLGRNTGAWLWQGLGFGFGFGTKFALQFQVCLYLSDKGGVGMESCAPGIEHYNLCGSIPPECVDPSHCFTLTSHLEFLMVAHT